MKKARCTWSWMKKYELAKAYYEHYGDLNIHQDFYTKNGVDYDIDGVALGVWLNNQRCAYKRQGRKFITEEQIRLLNEIGMIWYPFEYSWHDMYRLAKAYFEYYGDLNIRQHFKTTNGIDYDANGVLLGRWVHNQKMAYRGLVNSRLTPERIKLLEEIRIVWFSDRIDEKSQMEEISETNIQKKKIEILNRFYSVLNNYEESDLPDNNILNKEFMAKLNHKSLQLKKK